MQHEDDAPFEAISNARGRQILGEDADGLSDDDVERLVRYADTLAHVVIEMFLEQRASAE
jgi:hypothetical protein